jgi:L-fuconolactonase
MSFDIVDFQLHEPGNWLDWSGEVRATQHKAFTEMLLHMMESVGVEAALLHPTHEFDWAEGLAEQYPSKFGSVPMLHGDSPQSSHSGFPPELSPHMPDIEEQITKVYGRTGVRAIRFVPGPRVHPREFVKFSEGEYDRALKACEDQGVPILIHMSGGVDVLARPAQKFPRLQIIVDHIGLPQPPVEPVADRAWAALPDILALARHPNIALKLSGAPGLSTESYPFADSWRHVAQLIEAFTPERLAWGSDISRFRGRVGWRIRFPELDYVGKHNYMESLAFILYNDHLATEEKQQLLGGTARRLLKWPVIEDNSPRTSAR